MTHSPADPFDTPEGRAWQEDVRANMLPKLAESAASLTLYTGGMDLKLAVELGAAILLDKPIMIVVAPGVKVPEHLVRAADKIIEADILGDPKTAAAKVQAALSTFGITS